jgi:hypothetical protein
MVLASECLLVEAKGKCEAGSRMNYSARANLERGEAQSCKKSSQ